MRMTRGSLKFSVLLGFTLGGALSSCGANVRSGTGNESAAAANAGVSAPSSLSYSAPTVIYVYNDADSAKTLSITNNTPSITGSVESYSIAPDLTALTGLTFSTITGVISGKPTLTSAATNYTVTATNAAGSTAATVNIRTGPGFSVTHNGDANDSGTGDNECLTGTGVCTLRAAITQINAMSAISRMILIPSMTITLTSDLTAFTKSIEVIGESRTSSIINGAGAFRMFLYNAASRTLTLTELTLESSVSANYGPVVYTNSMAGATLIIQKSIIRNSYSTNTANSAAGGALNIGAGATITDTVFDNNGDNSSSIPAYKGTGTFRRCLFINNRNAISSRNPEGVFIYDSTFHNNSNTAGAAGGVHRIAGGSFTITNCTFSNNASSGGSVGSAIHGSSVVTNTVLASNGNGGNGVCHLTTSGGGNIAFPAEADCTPGPGDLASANPLLGALQDNGGETYTRALSGGSPAIDQGINGSCTATDQRGVARPQNGNCDSGAYEAD